MRRKGLRIAFSLLLVSAVIAGGMTLFAKPSKPGKGWTACPVPPCMAPCIYPAEPEVICKTPTGVVKTTWACCCCGSGGNSYKPLN